MKLQLAILLSLALAANAACPNACSGHGTCGLSSKCSCQSRWVGNDCSSRECPFGLSWVASNSNDNSPAGTIAGAAGLGGRHAYAECSNRGVCDRDSGECQCFEGYSGRGCRRTSCPADCSGHGRCRYNDETDTGYRGFGSDFKRQRYSEQSWDAGKTRACECDRGWEGIDCASRICPKGDDPLTDCNASPGVSENEVQLIMFKNDVVFDASKFFTLTFTDMFNGVLTTRPIATHHEVAAVTATASCAASVATCTAGTTSGACTGATVAGTWEASTSMCRGAAGAASGCAAITALTDNTACHASAGCIYAAAGDACVAGSGHTPIVDTCSLVATADVAANCAGTSYSHVTAAATSAVVYNSLAADVKAALEELPNFAIPSVTVTASAATDDGNGGATATADAPATCAGSSSCFHTVQVTFTDAANSGVQNRLVVNDPAVDHNQAHMQPRFSSYTGDQATVRSRPLLATANQHKERVECSNRGNCDASSGTCACYEGFTGEACQSQTVFF